jgi:hypothetical protein
VCEHLPILKPDQVSPVFFGVGTFLVRILLVVLSRFFGRPSPPAMAGNE